MGQTGGDPRTLKGGLVTCSQLAAPMKVTLAVWGQGPDSVPGPWFIPHIFRESPSIQHPFEPRLGLRLTAQRPCPRRTSSLTAPCHLKVSCLCKPGFQSAWIQGFLEESPSLNPSFTARRPGSVLHSPRVLELSLEIPSPSLTRWRYAR